MRPWGPRRRRSSARCLEAAGREEDRHSKYLRPTGSKGGKGPWRGGARRKPDYATQALLRAMTKLVIRQEELARIRIDTSWMLFVDTNPGVILTLLQQTAEAWRVKCGQSRSPQSFGWFS